MANKVQFPDGFQPKGQINKTDLILIADASSGNPFITTLDSLTNDKVDKANGKSLVLDTLITKLSNDYTKEQIDGIVTTINGAVTAMGNIKVDKVNGKSLVEDALINKLSTDYTKEQIDDIIENLDSAIGDVELALNTKVDKVSGKGLSTNDYSNSDKGKVDLIKTSGDSNKFLAETGEYRTVIAPIQSITVNEQATEIIDGNVNITTPDAPVQSISLNGVDVAPVNGNVDINVVVDVEQTIDPNSTNPVSSQAVASAFNELGNKYGAGISLSTSGEEGSEVYSINLLDEDGNVISSTDQFSGGGGSGEGATTKIVLAKITQNPTVKVNDEVVLEYSYDHIDNTSQSSTGLQGQATITITSGATTITKQATLSAGVINQLILTNKELKVGSNSIRIKVEVDNGDSIQVSTIVWSVLVVNLVLTSNYDISTITQKGASIFVPFTLTGSGNKNIKCIVNGVLFENRNITSSTATGSFTIPTNSFNHGNVRVELVAELDLSTGVIKSNSIYYDLILNQNGMTTPIVATRFNYQDGRTFQANERPKLVGRQLENINITYAVYHPQQVNKIVTVTIDGVAIASSSLPLQVTNTPYRSLSAGEYNGSINAYTFGVEISPSSINIIEPFDNLVYKFNAQGKANTDVNRNVWTSNTAITASLTGVKYSGDGWMGNTLKVTDNGRVTINHRPLLSSNALTSNSFAFQIKLKNTEVIDENIKVVSCVDADGTGFYITPIEAVFVSAGKSTATMKLAYGEVYNIAFVSFPTASETSSEYEKVNSNMIYLYVNGEIVGGDLRTNSDGIYQSNAQNVVIGGNGATTEIYNIRHYNRYLSDNEVTDIHLIDLDNVDEIINSYNFNDVLNENGNVSVDSLPSDARYIIFTGSTNGVPTALHSAIQNNKDTRYDITEILHICKDEPSLNFKLVGGCIRLQGTSSLAYPIKNYRFYIKNSAKVAGDLYLGVDENGNGGTLSSTPKWSFMNVSDSGKKPSPTDVWCLKADFAESSSSHNTGMARLVNTTLVKANELTPPQKHVSPSYQYDVRTTVDGTPCYLFYRNTVNDIPTFLGKYNLNNDKASEEAFGFKGITGYHDAPWVTEKFSGVNPTECWEFLNNDFPMGKYLDDDFDSMVEVDGKMIPSWMRAFEARYIHNEDLNEQFEAGTLKPTNLERLVKWVKSTQGNPTKFRNELANYFDVNYLCDYFVFTQMFGAVDQMVKNAMLAFYYNPDVDKVLAYYIFYDNDTILGVRNDGRLKYHWSIDRQTIDPEFGRPAYMGHDSILWNHLETGFANEIGDAYRRIRTRLTNNDIFNYFHTEQSDKFPQRIFNIDAINKYVKPLKDGYQYIESMQGSRKSHSKWWITNRLDLFDARYNTGDYRSTDLTWKGNSTAGAKIKATASRPFYFSVTRESAVMASSIVQPNVEWSYTYPSEANIGTIFHFYGGKWVIKLNLSEWGGFTDLNLPTMPVLQELIMGMDGRTYSLSGVQFADKIPMLKKLDIRNYISIPSLDLVGMPRLEELNARGCTTLSTINFATGANINKLTLPQNLKTLKLNGFANLTNANILFPDGNTVENLVVDNAPLVNWETLLTTLGNVQNIRVTNINREASASWLSSFENYGGIDANGDIVSRPRLQGKVKLTNFLQADALTLLRSKFPELDIQLPDYSTYIIYDKDITTGLAILDTKNVYNPDNNTGYGTSNAYVGSGHVAELMKKRHRVLGKQTSNGEMTICQLHDENSNYYADSVDVGNSTPALLDGTQGDVWVYEPAYWYKGVTDFDNKITYAYFSSNQAMPPTPTGTRKITYEDIVTLGYVVGNTYTKHASAVGQLPTKATGTQFNLIKLPVDGYKKIKFPIVTQNTENTYSSDLGYLWVDDNDRVVGKFTYNNDEASIGVDTIKNIPTNAKFLYIPFFKPVEPYEWYVNLSTTDNIFDIESDWVYSQAKLISPFQTSYDQSKNRLRSTKDYKGYPDMAIDLVEPILRNQNYTTLGVRYSNEVNLLGFFMVGDRNIGSIHGGGLAPANPINNGISTDYGMKETININFPTYTASNWYTTVDNLGVVNNITTPVPVSFGYEYWYTSTSASLDDTGFSVNNALGRGFIEFNNNYSPQHKKRLLLTSVLGDISPRYIKWGKYLDKTVVGKAIGSVTTFYTDHQAYNNNGYVTVAHNQGGSQFGMFYLHTNGNGTNPRYRLVFDKAIKFENNVNVFKSLTDVKL